MQKYVICGVTLAQRGCVHGNTSFHHDGPRLNSYWISHYHTFWPYFISCFVCIVSEHALNFFFLSSVVL